MNELQKPEAEPRVTISLSRGRFVWFDVLTGMAACGLSTLLFFLLEPTVSRGQMLFMYCVQMAIFIPLYGWLMRRWFRRRGEGCGESKPEPPNDAPGV
jgi:hypothetical protein